MALAFQSILTLVVVSNAGMALEIRPQVSDQAKSLALFSQRNKNLENSLGCFHSWPFCSFRPEEAIHMKLVCVYVCARTLVRMRERLCMRVCVYTYIFRYLVRIKFLLAISVQEKVTEINFVNVNDYCEFLFN